MNDRLKAIAAVVVAVGETKALANLNERYGRYTPRNCAAYDRQFLSHQDRTAHVTLRYPAPNASQTYEIVVCERCAAQLRGEG